MVEHLRENRAEGLQVARAVQLGTGQANVVADGAEIERAGQNGR